MDNLRREQLRECWSEEALHVEDWRENLTPEELDYVSGWTRSMRRAEDE